VPLVEKKPPNGEVAGPDGGGNPQPSCKGVWPDQEKGFGMEELKGEKDKQTHNFINPPSKTNKGKVQTARRPRSLGPGKQLTGILRGGLKRGFAWTNFGGG